MEREQVMHGWFAIFLPFQRHSFIPGRWLVDNERLCASEHRVRLWRFQAQAGLGLGTAGPVGQCLTYWPTRAPGNSWLSGAVRSVYAISSHMSVPVIHEKWKYVQILGKWQQLAKMSQFLGQLQQYNSPPWSRFGGWQKINIYQPLLNSIQ